MPFVERPGPAGRESRRTREGGEKGRGHGDRDRVCARARVRGEGSPSPAAASACVSAGAGGARAVLGVAAGGGSRCPPRRRGPSSSFPSRRLPSGPGRVPAASAAPRCAAPPGPARWLSAPAFPLGRLESRGAGRWSGPPLLVRPLAVQVPSAFRRGGLKTPWGVSPVRPWVGGGGRAGGEFRREGPGPSPRLTPHGLRPRAGAAPHARRRRRAPRRPSGGGFTRRPSSCRRARAARVSRVRAPRRGGGNPRAPVGCPRSPRRGRRARLPVEVKPSDPSPESGPVTCLAGRPEATPSGGVPCQEGLPVSGAPSPHRPRTTLSGGSLGSCVDEERS